MRHTKYMRTILVLTCCLALTAVVRAEDEADKTKTSEKVVKTKAVKTQVHSGQFKTNTNTLPAVQSNTNVQTGNNAQFKKQKNLATANNFKPAGAGDTAAVQSNTTVGNKAQFKKQNWSNQNSVQTSADVNVQKGWDGKSKKWSQGGNSKFQGQVNANKAWKIKKFSVQSSPNSKIASMKFKQNYKIQGSQSWKGQQYWAFQNYNSQWHDQGWWHSHHSKIILISGGYYYWDNGYWYPAWGYDSANEYLSLRRAHLRLQRFAAGPGHLKRASRLATAGLLPRRGRRVARTTDTRRSGQLSTRARFVHDFCDRPADSRVTGYGLTRF